MLGRSVASGDFDGDGYADLAIGRPVAYRPDEGAGAVAVLYGSAKGLTSARSLELLSPGGPEFDTGFGSALVTADFDGDGRSDLAVDWEEYLSGSASGTVVVFPGAAGGLAQGRNAVLRGRQGGGDETRDQDFGRTLAVGDLDEDGRPDLVVGSDRGSGKTVTGAVSTCYGTAQGVAGCTSAGREPGPRPQPGHRRRQRLGHLPTRDRGRGGCLRRRAGREGLDPVALRQPCRDDGQPGPADPGQPGRAGVGREGRRVRGRRGARRPRPRRVRRPRGRSTGRGQGQGPRHRRLRRDEGLPHERRQDLRPGHQGHPGQGREEGPVRGDASP